jgi:hypothetical protein
MTLVEKILSVTAAGTMFMLITYAFTEAYAGYREAKERRVFMSQCIEKWAVGQCKTWDRYGRRDLAFRKDS